MTLTEAIDAIAALLRAAMPDVPTVSADPPPQAQRAVRMPAVYLQLTELEPLGNPGDGRVSADARFEAYCIVDPNTPRAELACRELAARVILALHAAPRPLPGHGHLRQLRAGDADFRPELDGYRLWLVEFGIELQLGALEPAGITPTEIWLGTSPDIGPPHVDDYEQVE
jgi:hypothetical protein